VFEHIFAQGRRTVRTVFGGPAIEFCRDTFRLCGVMKDRETSTPGDGIKSLKTSRVFRIINFELYSKPNKIIMALGLVSVSFTFGYLVYMRHQYEKMGYYPAVAEDGRHEVYKQRQSKWD